MIWQFHRHRASRALAALLLAMVIGAQFGLVGHQHDHNHSVADCLQCQFDHSKVALSTGSHTTFHAPAEVISSSFTLSRAASPHYYFNARGPPAFS